MSWYDSITGIFSSAPEVSQTVTDMTSAYKGSDMLSSHYSIANLSPTTKALSKPNLPSTDVEISNMAMLADTAELLERNVGPFTILSGFRTKELQSVLSSTGEPTSAGTSFHELGRAVDIYPTTMGIAEFFAKILVDEDLKNRFVEIAIKPGQNSIHLAINVPDDTRDPRVMALNADNVYARLTVDEITSYITPYMPSPDMAYDYAAAQLVTYNRTPLILTAVVALAGAAYLLLISRKKTV